MRLPHFTARSSPRLISSYARVWPIRYRSQNSRMVIAPSSSALSNALDMIRVPSCIIARNCRRSTLTITVQKTRLRKLNILNGELLVPFVSI